MTQYARLQLFSKIVRFLILFAVLILSIGLLLEYGFGVSEYEWTTGDSEYRIGVTPDYHPKYQELKALDGVNLWLLSIYPLTLISIELMVLYWLQKLFGFYAKGQFFHQDTARCYSVLIWTFVFQFFFRYYEEYILWLFYPDKNKVGINAYFEAGEFVILLVLLVIAYVLKMANQIDKENKEFI